MQYVLVALLARVGKKSEFTYSAPESEKLEIGQLVTVPLRNKNVLGIVIEKTKKPHFPVRSIQKIISPEPMILPHLIKLAQWMSDYYLAPLSMIFSGMIPTGITKKRREIKSELTKNAPPAEKKPTLTKDQQNVIAKIQKSDKPSLLFGITGSGKTEIYMRLIEEVLNKGKQAIVLVPEISLTPQIYQRFEARFPGKVAILHSYLKETERHHNWEDIKNLQKPIVLGSRSAIFAPCSNLGLIVIDEEHETSYKQDQTPRYHAIDAAEKVAELTKAKLVLGSATPRLESFYKAKQGKYNLLELKERIGKGVLPEVDVVNLSNEFKMQNRTFISEKLKEAIQKTLNEKKQVLLFLNRRGFATYSTCRDCNFVLKCPNCDIPLIYHHPKSDTQDEILICHHCNFSQAVPVWCPKCSGILIKFLGVGTQKVENEIQKIFPKAKVLRMDKDTTAERGAVQKIFEDFQNQKADILIGTQMIAKGWDLENVHLVGIILADTALNLPDFRAHERTFNLLSQVAGRTNRGHDKGQVIIQTFDPDIKFIKFVKSHDYESFYNSEIESRKTYHLPPFVKIIKIGFSDKDEEKGLLKARDIASKLEKIALNTKEEILVFGPSPSFIYRLRGFYNWDIIIKVKIGKLKLESEEKIKEVLQDLPAGFTVDIDPMSML